MKSPWPRSRTKRLFLEIALVKRVFLQGITVLACPGGPQGGSTHQPSKSNVYAPVRGAPGDPEGTPPGSPKSEKVIPIRAICAVVCPQNCDNPFSHALSAFGVPRRCILWPKRGTVVKNRGHHRFPQKNGFFKNNSTSESQSDPQNHPDAETNISEALRKRT